MSVVNCTIHGDCEESGSKCSFYSQPPLTISVLHKMFPYEGDFKFRLKVRGSLAGLKEEFVWLDLSDTVVTEFSSCMSSEEIEIQAVVVSLPQGLGNTMKYANYLDEVASEFSECTRPNRHPVVDLESENHESNRNKMRAAPGKEMLKMISKGVRQGAKSLAQNSKNLNVNAVQKGAASIWSTVKKLQQSMSVNEPLSDRAEENLSHLSEDVSTSFIESDSIHISLLSNLWEVLFPREGAFQRISTVWKDAGFQKTDPVADLKASGVLSIRAMTYLVVKYPLKAQAMLNANKLNTKTNYPFAIVGINITLLLAELLNLRDQRYERKCSIMHVFAVIHSC
jgi:ELMO/CED-12 family